MADEFQIGSGNWWEATRRNRSEMESGSLSPPPSSSSGMGSYRWPTQLVVEMKLGGGSSSSASAAARRSIDDDSAPLSSAGVTSSIDHHPIFFQDTNNTTSTTTTHKLQMQSPRDQGRDSAPPHVFTTSNNSNLQMMMGLGLPSSSLGMLQLDYQNQPFPISGEKGDQRSFQSMVEEEDNMLSWKIISSFDQQEEEWQTKPPMYSISNPGGSTEDSSRAGRGGEGFSLHDDHRSHLITTSTTSPPPPPHHHRHLISRRGPSTEDSTSNSINITCPTAASFQMDSSSSSTINYPNNNRPNSSTMFQQRLLAAVGSETNRPQQQSAATSFDDINYSPYNNSSSLDQHHQPLTMILNHPNNVNTYWSKPPPPLQAQDQLLHLSNNASSPFWNATPSGAAVAMIHDAPTSNLLSSLQMPLMPSSTFHHKNYLSSSEVEDLGTVTKKSSSTEPSTMTKRPRNENPSPLPAFKARKEKMGDRITALQQLVSPFGKTDTASVLSEAIEYIKFLHQQVSVLSNPYMKSGVPVQQQECEKFKEESDEEEQEEELRSRGLCVVPVSSITFPVTHDQTSTVDFWNPTFGGT